MEVSSKIKILYSNGTRIRKYGSKEIRTKNEKKMAETPNFKESDKSNEDLAQSYGNLW